MINLHSSLSTAITSRHSLIVFFVLNMSTICIAYSFAYSYNCKAIDLLFTAEAELRVSVDI